WIFRSRRRARFIFRRLPAEPRLPAAAGTASLVHTHALGRAEADDARLPDHEIVTLRARRTHEREAVDRSDPRLFGPEGVILRDDLRRPAIGTDGRRIGPGDGVHLHRHRVFHPGLVGEGVHRGVGTSVPGIHE